MSLLYGFGLRSEVTGETKAARRKLTGGRRSRVIGSRSQGGREHEDSCVHEGQIGEESDHVGRLLAYLSVSLGLPVKT